MRNGVVTGMSRVGMASSLIKAVPLSQLRVPRAGVATQISTQVTPFTPLDLFAQGEAGFWYDFSDPTTMFQDVAGTVPVESFGDPVALVLDKSGNGYHATQETNAARPIWTQDAATGLVGVAFDGVDDSLDSAVIAELQDALDAHVSVGIIQQSFADRTIFITPTRGFSLRYTYAFGAEGVSADNIPSFRTNVTDGLSQTNVRVFNRDWRTPLTAVLSMHARAERTYRQFRFNGATITDGTQTFQTAPRFDANSVTLSPGRSLVTQMAYRVAQPLVMETQMLEQYIGKRTGLVP
jgi:hypothetical protein